jgi:hypothetical protein
MADLLSVVIPADDLRRYVAEAVESTLAQSYWSLKALVVFSR